MFDDRSTHILCHDDSSLGCISPRYRLTLQFKFPALSHAIALPTAEEAIAKMPFLVHILSDTIDFNAKR
jgi:hypothetical protein